MRRHVLMWQPPPHQHLIHGEHSPGHRCGRCTTFSEPRVESRRFTRWGAQRRLDWLLNWSVRPGKFWIRDTPGEDVGRTWFNATWDNRC